MLIRNCGCGAALPERLPGTQGRPRTRCDACRAAPRAKAPRKRRTNVSSARRSPAGPEQGHVVVALRAELALLPERVRVSTEAAVALELARQVDQGLSLATASRELTRVMAVLRAMAPAAQQKPSPPGEGDDVDEAARRPGVADLAARAAARRAAAAG